MAIEYLYIDDEHDDTATGIKSNLEDKGNLIITLDNAYAWDRQIEIIRDRFQRKEFDGLLLDLKLKFPVDNKALTYDAPALAQQIRTLIKAGDLEDFPILLCSTDTKLKALHDETGKDLFEESFEKTSLVPSYSECFISHVEAYQSLITNKSNLKKILCLEKAEMIGQFDDLLHVFLDKQTIHEKARLLYQELFKDSEILIEEKLLAIRLGIDLEKSSSLCWTQLKSELDFTLYSGIYHKIASRWWLSLLLEWWSENFVNPLQVLSAHERVEKLKSKFSVEGLVPIEKPSHHRYDSYWYACYLSGTPLDPVDAFKVIETPRYSWQSPRYISNKHVNNPERDTQKIKSLLSGSELRRFNKILEKERS